MDETIWAEVIALVKCSRT